MYRDDVASQEARADQLRRDIAEVEARIAKLRADRATVETEARTSDATVLGALGRWWGIALVVLALGAGAVLGNQIAIGHRTVNVCR